MSWLGWVAIGIMAFNAAFFLTLLIVFETEERRKRK